jgi:peptidoglycan/LPS O-acetylase OafA/YrhL
LTPLEASRGIASIIVVVHHFLLAFAPGLKVRASGHFYFAIVNGSSAVGFFFTLSGFVLCWSFLNRKDPQLLAKAFLKRWPRLVGIVLVTTVCSYLLFALGFYHYSAAAAITNSQWLATFAHGMIPIFQPRLIDAVLQGLTTFFTGDSQYNTNLWTMRFEFAGSLTVYSLAAFVSAALKFRFMPYTATVISIAALFFGLNIFPFVVGFFLAVFFVRTRPHAQWWTAVIGLLAGMYLLGYDVPEKDYLWVSLLPNIILERFDVIAYTTGSACIMFSLMANGSIYGFFNRKLFEFLGKLSFPLYLVHTVVILSASSYVFLILRDQNLSARTVLILVFLMTITLSIVASLPLIKLDAWWVNKVDSYIRRNILRSDVQEAGGKPRDEAKYKSGSRATPGESFMTAATASAPPVKSGRTDG